MGEIPSWLIELAESAEGDEGGETPNQEPIQVTDQLPESGFLEEPVTLMDELRSQVVEEPVPDETVLEEPKNEILMKPIAFAGMVPWQIAVLSVLLFFDIAVIGMLFLAMLGRISIP